MCGPRVLVEGGDMLESEGRATRAGAARYVRHRAGFSTNESTGREGGEGQARSGTAGCGRQTRVGAGGSLRCRVVDGCVC